MARRSRANREFIYGRNPVHEALNGKRSLFTLWVGRDQGRAQRVGNLVELAERRGIAIEYVAPEKLESLAEGGNHQGVVLESAPFPYQSLDEITDGAAGRPIIILDHVQDPQNLATLIRTAVAVDAAGLVIQSDRSASITPAVVRASSGMVERFPIARESNTRRTINTLKDCGYWAIALEQSESSANLYRADVPTPVALVIGSEGRGMAGNVLKACDLAVFLPMPGPAESLNAAIAGSVVLYELLRRSYAENGQSG